MKTTPFYEAARQAADIYKHYHFYVCLHLGREESMFFKKYFKPENGNYAFMCEKDYDDMNGVNINNSNAHRIISLLFADLMWRDEHE